MKDNRHRPYARQFRQFKNLSSRIDLLVRKNLWSSLSASSRRLLLERLKASVRGLAGVFSPVLLKKALGAASVLLGISLTARAQTPAFGPPALNPFNIVAVGAEATPGLADLDGDGDLDLFVGDYYNNFSYFENTGTATAPGFAAPDTIFFGLDEFDAPPVPVFADIDNDGDIDLLAGQSDSTGGYIAYYENIGTVNSPLFDQPVRNPWGITGTIDYSYPTLADLDNDGDLDLFIGEYYGNTVYFENSGTASAPAFAAAQTNPFGIAAVNRQAAPVFADLDGDSDFDLMAGEYLGNLVYFENTGTSTAPSFASEVRNPFGLVPVIADSERIRPVFADLDADGDLDLLVGEYYGNCVYFENATPVGLPQEMDHALVRVFSDPRSGQVTIESGPLQGAGQIWIYNTGGQLLRTAETWAGQRLRIDLPLAPGIYVVVVSDQNRILVSRKVLRY